MIYSKYCLVSYKIKYMATKEPMFFLQFFIFRPSGNTKTYSGANSSSCWMKILKVDENESKLMNFW